MRYCYLVLFVCMITLSLNGKAQDGNFNNLTFNSLTKGDGYSSIYGWGINPGNTIDARPNSSNGGALIINHHMGLSFSAHSTYGGIRFYNQGYPNGFDPAQGAQMVMSISNGAVGVGTTNSMAKLHIIHEAQDSEGNSLILGPTNSSNLRLGYNINYSWIQSHGSMPLYINEFGNNLILNRTAGNVGIGTTTPQEKLSVNGNIRAKEIKVETTNWPDYVFRKDYKLPSLAETEKHIQEKGHLPGIQSAQEAEANGVDLGELNKKLLQKIEELTLHLIEKDKQLTAEKAINADQERRIRLLEENSKKQKK